MEHTTKATQALEALRVPYQVKIHEHEITSLEQAARERGLDPEQIVRSLLFRIASDDFVLVLCPGGKTISWPALRDYLQVSRMTTASAEEVLKITGYPPGTVSPFGLPKDLRLLADHSVGEREWISVGVGIRNAGVVLRARDLLHALQPEMGDFKVG